MRLQFLEQDIGRDLKNNVGDEEDGQGRVVFCSLDDVEVLRETQDFGVTDVHSLMGIISSGSI
jgi:hypothetical protein